MACWRLMLMYCRSWLGMLLMPASKRELIWFSWSLVLISEVLMLLTLSLMAFRKLAICWFIGTKSGLFSGVMASKRSFLICSADNCSTRLINPGSVIPMVAGGVSDFASDWM